MDESGINLNFDLDEIDQERILEIVKSDLVDSVLSELPPSDFPNFDFYELRSKTVPLSTSLNESPTLKTEVVRSRTQLKQQLMRDQELIKEQERRRIIEEEAAIAAESFQEPISIPVNVSSVQLPEHVLQVKSALENPTRYHILAKQKNQVLQFLNSSETEDFVSKFDAQKVTLQLKQQQQQVQLQISQRQQVQDQYKQQLYQQKQFQQQERILQRRQMEKKRQLQLQYQEQWHINRLEQMQNMEHEEKLEQMQLMEHEQLIHQKRQQRQLFYFQQQQHEEELERQHQLKARQQLERQQLLHQHLMEKQQLQQQFQMEKQQLHQQQEQLRLQQQLLKHQRQKQLQKQAQAEDKAEGEALIQAQAEIRARIRKLLYGETCPEAQTEDHEQQQLQKLAHAKAEAEALKDAQARKQVQAMEQAEAMEQAQAQLQLLGQPQVQEPERMQEQQDEACALPLDSHNISQEKTLHDFISDLTKDASIGEEKSIDNVSFDVCYTMPGNLYGPQSGHGEPDSLFQDDTLKIKWTSSCPSGLEHYDQELSPYSLHHAKSRIRKDNHNIVERRRRSNINDRIKELADLLPKVNEPYYEVVKDSKNNKGAILKSTVEYIKYLKFMMIHLRQIEINNRQLLEQNNELILKLREIEYKSKQNEREKEMLMRHQAWMIVKPHSFAVSVVKDDEMDKNESEKNENSKEGSSKNENKESKESKESKEVKESNECNESNKSESSSSNCEIMMEEDDTDKDEIF